MTRLKGGFSDENNEIIFWRTAIAHTSLVSMRDLSTLIIERAP